MTSVWKRLQRVNKRAAKFQFTASYHRVDVETTSKWKPNKLSVVWSRRSRRVVSEPLDWEPSMKEPLKGSVIWAVPDNHTIAVTLFRDQRTNELEDKDWIFILEDVSSNGRRRRIAQAAVNLRPLASLGPSQQCLSLQMRPSTTKVTSASMEVTISSVLLREGSAADEDMQSMASMMSMNNNSDIAPLDDFEEDDCSLSDNSASIQQMLDLTQQMEMMTSSLAGTPGSIASLDSTPTASTPLDPLKIPVPLNPLKIPIPLDPSSKNHSAFNPNSDGPKANITSMKPRSIFDPISFTTTKHHLSKKNLKPLELKTNHNDFAYSENLEESNSNVTTPVVDLGKESDKTPIVQEVSRGKLSRESSREDSMGKEPAVALDLLQWCQQVTAEYPQCKVANLTTSWTDGVAFCAIIHHFRPNLIDMTIITPNDAENNIRIALKASEALGVPGVFHASELRRARGPDRLALLTYLHQLRALFTHRQYRLDKIGPTSEESSYTIGRFNTDKDTDISVELFSQEILTMRQKRLDAQPATNRTSLSSQGSIDSQHSQDRSTAFSKPNAQNVSSPDRISVTEATFQKEKSPVNAMKDMKDMILASSKNIFGKVLSPTKDKLASIKSPFEKFTMNKDSGDAAKHPPVETKDKKDSAAVADAAKSQQPAMGVTVREAWPVKLMTRKQLTDPFGSDEEDDDVQDVLTVHLDDSKSKQPKLEMKEQKILEIKNEDISHSTTSNERETTPLSPLECLPKPNQQLLSRHDELKERARQLLEATRREAREKDGSRETSPVEQGTNSNSSVKEKSVSSAPGNKQSEEARQARLRERARKLIAEARAGMVGSPTSPDSRTGTVEVLTAAQALAEQQFASGMTNSALGGSLESSPSRSIKSETHNSDSENNFFKKDGSPEHNGNHSPLRQGFESGVNKASSPLKSFAELMDRISPDKDSYIMRGFGKDMNNYIQSEMEALEREQSAIDQQAAILEKELREVMESGQSEAEENALMASWFTLVNKKNALLRRQMQLNILEQESELRQRHAKVDGELRELLDVDEWSKSENQRGREARLLNELMRVVDARNQLVHHLHEHEQAIEDDDEIERNLSHVELQRKNQCSIQ